MKLRIPPSRSLGAVVVVLVGILLFAGSIPTSVREPKRNAALVEVVGKVTEDGGNVVLGSSRLCDSFDPSVSFDAWCAVVFRLYSRNLMAFSNQSGDASFEVQPDLAESAPKVSASRMYWTFSLRKNARWNNGEYLTAEDVRYSIERLYSPAVLGAVNYKYLCLLSDCPKGVPSYKGPGKKGDNHLSAIRLSGKNTITFRLTSPNPDFARVLALPQFAIISKQRDLYLKEAKKSYSALPSSSGPFVFKRDKTTKAVSFTRNKYWIQASDAIRQPHVDSFTWKVIPSVTALNQATLVGDIDIRLGEDLTLSDVGARNQLTRFSSRVDQPFTGFTSFLAVRPMTGPLDRTSCRQAIFYAVNKKALAEIKGGDQKAQIANSMLAPNIAGFDSGNDLLGSADHPEGDLAAADAALKKCGYPEGFEVTMAYLNVGIGSQIFKSIQSSLARVGIVVAPKKYDNYSKFISITRSTEELNNENISLIVSGVQSQVNSPLDFWSGIADGRLIKPFDNENLALLDSTKINDALDNLIAESSRAANLSAEINDEVMSRAVYLPYAYDRIVLYRNPAIVGIYVQQALGSQYDLVNVGLSR